MFLKKWSHKHSPIEGCRNPLKAAVTKCNAKYAKHGKIHNDNLILFWPLVLESNGAMHSYLRHLIFFAADHADKDKPPDAMNWSTPSFKLYWTARISCANRFATAGKINKAVSKLCSEHKIPGFGMDSTRCWRKNK